uniref:Sushi domain-containing protein n=1 Tax=Serinus canaria TaxID=9135 RepID=A0A8C9NTA3_SERCA
VSPALGRAAHPTGGFVVPALGQLGSSPLLAVPPCPSPPIIRNGQHDSKEVTEFVPGMAVKYHCDPGYVLAGKSSVSCLPSGVWSIPYPRCEGELQMLPVAEGRRAVYHPGDNVTFQCHPGFVLRGSRGAKCQPDSRWVPAVPTCQPGESCAHFGGTGNKLVALLKFPKRRQAWVF